MSAPIVVVTRDASGQPLTFEWHEDERRAYDHAPMFTARLKTAHNVWEFQSLRNTADYVPSILPFVKRLLENPFANVDEFETHHWPEPGAPLEPVVSALARSVGCDLTPLCPAAQHVGTCLGLYRTVDEVTREFVPDVSVLAQRRANERFHRAYMRAGGGAG